MKYIKIYEDFSEPQIGDYVICIETWGFTDEVSNFVENNIGQYIAKNKADDFFIIQYENIPDKLRGNLFFIDEDFTTYENCAVVERFEIKYWSPNKNDLKIYLDIDKYNL